MLAAWRAGIRAEPTGGLLTTSPPPKRAPGSPTMQVNRSGHACLDRSSEAQHRDICVWIWPGNSYPGELRHGVGTGPKDCRHVL
jgi:hypothetical protein